MFDFMRERARAGKGRGNSIRHALEELDGRDVPSASVAAPIHFDHGMMQGPTAFVGPLQQVNTNGAAGQIPAFFNGTSVTINVKQLSDNAAESLLANNPNIKTIFVTNDLDDEQDFAPVINAVPGQGFNALWKQVLIQFNSGVTPHQFTSEADILAAANTGEITLVDTGEVYRDSVVGAGKHG